VLYSIVKCVYMCIHFHIVIRYKINTSILASGVRIPLWDVGASLSDETV
jgi:hypothetical protein